MTITNNPRYVVRIIKFKCVDESGFDFLGSDEPYWVFTAKGPDPDGEVNTTRSREFAVDSGDTKNFATDNNRNVIWPKKAAIQGGPGPIALSIQLWEADQGDPDDVTNKTQLAFTLGSVAPFIGQWVREVPPIVRDQIANLFADDLMGSKTLLYTASTLSRRLPNPGDKLIEKHRFGGNSGDLPYEVAGGPDYDLYIEIARVA